MTFRTTVKKLRDGHYYARCETGPNGLVERLAPTEEEALEKVRAEIEYQLDWCPCTGAARSPVELEVQRGR